MGNSPAVSIIIKTYNEGPRIEKCLASIEHLRERLSIEVILADSLSTDDTVQKALKFPVTISRLMHPEDRCCGIGPQLGFQYASGDYIYMLDGDMELLPGFMEQAIEVLESDKTLAGVGGLVHEAHISNMQFMGRTRNLPRHMKPGKVDRLAMGGLYRRSALDDVGYFSNRNLHAFEELDLALRLRAKGWGLARIDVPAVIHHGHTLPTWQLLRARWRSGYAQGSGELLRASLGQPYLLEVVKEFRAFVATLAYWFVLMLLLLAAPLVGLLPLVFGLSVFVFIPIVMAVRKRHFALGVYSVVAWQVFTAGMVRGFLKSPHDPCALVVATIVKEARQGMVEPSTKVQQT